MQVSIYHFAPSGMEPDGFFVFGLLFPGGSS